MFDPKSRKWHYLEFPLYRVEYFCKIEKDAPSVQLPLMRIMVLLVLVMVIAGTMLQRRIWSIARQASATLISVPNGDPRVPSYTLLLGVVSLTHSQKIANTNAQPSETLKVIKDEVRIRNKV